LSRKTRPTDPLPKGRGKISGRNDPTDRPSARRAEKKFGSENPTDRPSPPDRRIFLGGWNDPTDRPSSGNFFGARP